MNRDAARGVIVVSNRSPYDFDHGDVCHHKSGGLVQAMEPVLGPESLWIGISRGDSDFERANSDHKIELPSITMRKVFVPESTYVSYYNTFANSFLWPLMHCDTRAWFDEAQEFPKPTFDAGGQLHYRLVNQTFAGAVVEELLNDPKRNVWLHDYHFMELPTLLRDMCAAYGLSPRIGQTWHIPWVDPALLERIVPADTPARRAFTQLVYSMLENDIISFHVHRYAVNFIQTLRVLGITVRVLERREGKWRLCIRKRCDGGFQSKTLAVVVLPVGVNTTNIVETTASDALYDPLSHRFARTQYHLHRAGKRLCVGLERLDYTKGIPSRLRVVGELCDTHSLVYYGVAQPSRGEVCAYQQLRKYTCAVQKIVNTAHGRNSILPVTLELSHGITPPANYVLLKHADVCFVTTLSDGMNLVVLEAIIAKHALPREQRGFVVVGVCGASDMLSFFGEEDGIVRLPDPVDVSRSAQTIAHAIERNVSISDRLIAYVRARHDVLDWSSAFLEELRCTS